MNVVEKFDSGEKKDYPYNSDNLGNQDDELIGEYQEVENVRKPIEGENINRSQSKFNSARSEQKN